MFISIEEIKSIVERAHNDLRVFLGDWLDRGHFRNEWLAAEKELLEHPNAPGAAGFVEFVEPFLDQLEARQADPVQSPWVTDRQKGIYLPRSSKCHFFLKSLLDNLESLIEPSEEQGIKIRQCARQPSTSLQSFARFTAERQGCILSYNDIDFDWQRYPGFASWLIVYRDEEGEEEEEEADAREGDEIQQGELHVVSNVGVITRSSKEMDTLTRRFEKAFLHELGHARTGLLYYFDAPATQGTVCSRPQDEARAWLYTYALETCISSARARISRLVRGGDGEWR